MNTITKSMVTEQRLGHFVAEASELGLKPGMWPATIPTTLGNAQQFEIVGQKVQNGELLGVDYKQAAGSITLHILND